MNGLNDSPLSGHSALLGRVERKWQDTEYVLSYFGIGRVRRKNYYKYVIEGIDLGRRPELVGGGLVRSLGGWSEVLALRTRKERHAFDSRILGDSDFVQDMKTDLDDMIKKNLRIQVKGLILENYVTEFVKRGMYHYRNCFQGVAGVNWSMQGG